MKIVTLIGADASGKDTQAAKLKHHFSNEGKKVQVISIWDSMVDFAHIEDKKTLQKTVESFLLNFEAEARSFFLLSCLLNSERKIKSDSDLVIMNGFYQKYWASEMVYGVSEEFWKKNCPVFLTSDKIFYLNTPLKDCQSRKEVWSSYEQGLGKYHNRAPLSRHDFQKELHEKLDCLVSLFADVTVINGAASEEKVFQEILEGL